MKNVRKDKGKEEEKMDNDIVMITFNITRQSVYQMLDVDLNSKHIVFL